MGEPGQPLPPCPHCRAAHPEEILICPNTNRVLGLEGRLLDRRFRFVSMLGEGGMSTVWMAENHRVRKNVAIKLLHPEFARNPRTLDRFQNEATAAGRIGNPHICDILDLGESPLGPYIVMEMLMGQSFGELLDSQGRIDPPLAVLIIREALKGLTAAHAVGIIHRDLKPENVFIHEPEPGRMLVKLMDFGISKFTDNPGGGRTGANVVMGTPEYMSPEQAGGAANVDARTDIWAMGVMLYRALAGVEPFRGKTMAALLLALSTDDQDPLDSYVPEIHPGLSAVVDRCLAKEPEHRYATADELYDALAPYQQAVAAGERPSAPIRTGRTVAITPDQMPKLVAQQAAAAVVTSAPSKPAAPATAANTPTGSQPVLAVSTLVEPSQSGPQSGNSRAQTWSTELGTPPNAGDSWSMGKDTFNDDQGRSQRRRERARGGWLGWVVAVLVLGLIGGGVAWAWTQGMLDGLLGGDSELASTSTDSDAQPAGDEDAVTAGAEQPPSDLPADTDTAATETGASAGSETGAETDSLGDEGSTGDGDGDAGTGGNSGGSGGGSGTSGGDPKPKPKPPDMSSLVQVGGLYTHKSRGPNGNWATAKNYCRSLKRKNRHNLSKWRMATVSEIVKFRGTEIERLLYWSSETSGDKAKAVTMVTGKASERENSNPSPRAFCVSRR